MYTAPGQGADDSMVRQLISLRIHAFAIMQYFLKAVKMIILDEKTIDRGYTLEPPH